MKKLLLLALLMFSLSVSAQRIDKPNEPYYVYCVITLSMSFEAQFTIGMEEETYYILDEEGNKYLIELRMQ